MNNLLSFKTTSLYNNVEGVWDELLEVSAYCKFYATKRLNTDMSIECRLIWQWKWKENSRSQVDVHLTTDSDNFQLPFLRSVLQSSCVYAIHSDTDSGYPVLCLRTEVPKTKKNQSDQSALLLVHYSLTWYWAGHCPDWSHTISVKIFL